MKRSTYYAGIITTAGALGLAAFGVTQLTKVNKPAQAILPVATLLIAGLIIQDKMFTIAQEGGRIEKG